VTVGAEVIGQSATSTAPTAEHHVGTGDSGEGILISGKRCLIREGWQKL
jgi:hypothetical protein